MKTCEELIGQIRHRGDCNGDFKNQMEIFYSELKEFFNAQGLDKLLDQIKQSVNNTEICGQIDTFWHHKATVKGVTDKIFDFLGNLTALRRNLIKVSTSLVDDNGKKTLYQQSNLADIELEKFCFMKVSETIQNFSHHRNIGGILGLMQIILDNLITSNYG